MTEPVLAVEPEAEAKPARMPNSIADKLARIRAVVSSGASQSQPQPEPEAEAVPADDSAAEALSGADTISNVMSTLGAFDAEDALEAAPEAAPEGAAEEVVEDAPAADLSLEGIDEVTPAKPEAEIAAAPVVEETADLDAPEDLDEPGHRPQPRPHRWRRRRKWQRTRWPKTRWPKTRQRLPRPGSRRAVRCGWSRSSAGRWSCPKAACRRTTRPS